MALRNEIPKHALKHFPTTFSIVSELFSFFLSFFLCFSFFLSLSFLFFPCLKAFWSRSTVAM